MGDGLLLKIFFIIQIYLLPIQFLFDEDPQHSYQDDMNHQYNQVMAFQNF